MFLTLGLGAHSCQSEVQEIQELKKPTFKEMLVDIREKNISPVEARELFKVILSDIKSTYDSEPYDSLKMDLVFPLRSKNYRSVGGRGRGFYGRHFDLFDHKVAKSHPAHDIFIYDLNRDCKDDNDKDYVDVVAVNDGVVVAVEKEWSEELGYRGGNYVWLYDFKSGGLWYYAHQREVNVVEGQLIRQGDKLGQVGRTGFNAETNRSDTHLHLMYLKIDKELNPLPVNHFPWLKKARTIKTIQLPVDMPRKDMGDVSSLSVKAPSLIETEFKLPLN